ncbi:MULTISPECIES: AzlC family ABC transporter permease [unclassified Aureimonas]|uniref:AzlC family ABC transporter permease n=1 Tax=unclassified Aureimonas TaxID=2615206 RepID=UPI0006FC7D39|nr:MULTISPECIES: AzlC family ABC transporter permease [unclassified Aureimonas]KQT62257.1 branched-chain amino acid permease [Aureimonas sp. Leaf427]KQT72507.1 branched-chain amino acid permease [Aureimonas sp. Leaf460]
MTVAEQTRPHESSFKSGVVACGPTILGYWSIGFAAGAIGSVAGFSLMEIGVLAGLLYAGSAQFMFYSLYAAGAGAWAIVMSVLLVNLRYVLMSSHLATFFQGRPLFERFLAGALLTDETFGVAAQRAQTHGRIPFSWLLGLNVTAYGNWIFANLCGAVLASSIPQAITKGLGFSLTAMFVGLLTVTWFASRTKLVDMLVILVTMAIVAVMHGHIDANATILVATILAATAGTAVVIGLRREEDVSA